MTGIVVSRVRDRRQVATEGPKRLKVCRLQGWNVENPFRKTRRVLSKGMASQQDAPSPRFFVSVASKGFSQSVSLLFATLARESISVAAKGLKAIVGGGQWTVLTESGSALRD